MFLSQRGVSLVQTLVAIGILGAGSVAVMRLTQIGTQGARVTQQKFEQIEMSNSMSSWLGQAPVCQRNFGAAGVNITNWPDLANNPVTIDPLVAADGTPKWTVGEVYQSGMLRLTGMELRGYTEVSVDATETLAETIFRVNLERTGTGTGTREVRFDVNVLARFTTATGNLVSCNSTGVGGGAGGGGASLWELTGTGDNIWRLNGNVGIGSVDPISPLHVSQNPGVATNAYIQSPVGTNSVLRLGDGTANREIDFYVQPNGEFGITSTEAPNRALMMKRTGEVAIGYNMGAHPRAENQGPTLMVRPTGGASGTNGGILVQGTSNTVNPAADLARIAITNYGIPWVWVGKQGYSKFGSANSVSPAIYFYGDSNDGPPATYPAVNGVNKMAFLPGGTGPLDIPSTRETFYFGSGVEINEPGGGNLKVDNLTLSGPSVAGGRDRIYINNAGLYLRSNNASEHSLVVGKIEGTQVFIKPDGEGIFSTIQASIIQGRGGPIAIPSSVTITNNLTVTGTFTNPSDKNLKDDIYPIENSLARINQLNPVEYFWKPELKNDSRKQMGFIAQELQNIYPELVSELEGGDLGLNYLGLIAPIVGSIQELNQKVEDQHLEIEDLREKVKTQEKLINEILERLE